MLSRSRPREPAARTIRTPSTMHVAPIPVDEGTLNLSVESRGPLFARARERLSATMMSERRVSLIETPPSRSDEPRLSGTNLATSAPSGHCFFVDGEWKCVGDRCGIQQHRPD
jgi:hypothetical protein